MMDIIGGIGPGVGAWAGWKPRQKKNKKRENGYVTGSGPHPGVAGERQVRQVTRRTLNSKSELTLNIYINKFYRGLPCFGPFIIRLSRVLDSTLALGLPAPSSTPLTLRDPRRSLLLSLLLAAFMARFALALAALESSYCECAVAVSSSGKNRRSARPYASSSSRTVPTSLVWPA